MTIKTLRGKTALTVMLSLISGAVLAHPGHGESGLLMGCLHPLSGVDHLLAMLAVGLWAGRTGGAARWQLPLAFLAAMSLGWLAGLSGWVLPWMENGIAASVLALGLILALSVQLPRFAQIGVTALFALFHGCTHGVELPVSAPFATTLGFLLSTATLHAAGLGMARLMPGHRQTVYRAAGIGFALVGTALLMQ